MRNSLVSTTPVEVSGGLVSGLLEGDSGLAVFRGIPYAAPPLGKLRWCPPAPVRPWHGVLNAHSYAACAFQRWVDTKLYMKSLCEAQGWPGFKTFLLKNLFYHLPMPRQSEDCLYLNIRTPSMEKDSLLPVMVWIHGGDHQNGCGSERIFNSDALAREGVVHVTFNYRLGIMGFLAHPELGREDKEGISGNYGTLDQIALLKWVRDNVRNFGGDPEKVTIFGQSAGAESVAHMMTSPLARGLFSRAIMQSPGSSGQMLHLKRGFLRHRAAEESGRDICERLASGSGDIINCLRDMPARSIYRFIRKERERGYFYPSIDGRIIPESPLAAFSRGAQARVPLVVGSNSDECSVLFELFPTPAFEESLGPVKRDDVPGMISGIFPGGAERLEAMYPGLMKGGKNALSALLGDYTYGSRARFYAKMHERAGNRAWLYFFSRGPAAPAQRAGAYHGAEIPFVNGSFGRFIQMVEPDMGLSHIMRSFWAGFAERGSPEARGLPAWPPFRAGDMKCMHFGDAVGCRDLERNEAYDIFDERTSRLIEAMNAVRES